MVSKRLLGLATTAALLTGAACDRSASSTSTAGQTPSTRGSSDIVAATTRSATTTAPRTAAAEPPKPVGTFMSITLGDGGQPLMVAFPPAKLRLKKAGDGVQAVLYTDDPPEAASQDYRGNSYLFEMELTNVTSAAELDRAQHRFRAEPPGSAAAGRQDDTKNGVFLNGWDTHLRPVDVVVAFEGVPPLLMAKAVGTFEVVTRSEKDAPPRLAVVQAMLPVSVETK